MKLLVKKLICFGCFAFILFTVVIYMDRMTGKNKREPMVGYINPHPNETMKSEAINHTFKDIKILCWVLTMPKHHDDKATAVKNTWGKRCDKLVFMSSKEDKSLPSIDLGLNESRRALWGKAQRAFKYCYDHYLNDFDWFLKADDDTFVVIENLKYMLSAYDPHQDTIYFGSRFRLHSRQGFMSGGGGYILSRVALKAFVEKALTNPSKCRINKDTAAEDVEMAICLDSTNVLAGDSRDHKSHGRFFPFEPVDQIFKNAKQKWYWRFSYYPAVSGLDCCSDLAISFHYITPKRMYELEYLIYHLHPYGIQFNDPFPASLPPDKKSIPKRLANHIT